MSTNDVLTNKVAKSGLITLDLEMFKPSKPIAEFDISSLLFMGLILKEQDFRNSLDAIDFSQYTNNILAVHCSTDAIIPEWAWMLIVSKAKSSTSQIFFGTKESVEEHLMMMNAERHNWEEYLGRKVLLKGCGDGSVKSSLYLKVTDFLMDYADRVMYGEACSFVPIWRRSSSNI
jgi:hypothetical protein